jgi:hypothetical protein
MLCGRSVPVQREDDDEVRSTPRSVNAQPCVEGGPADPIIHDLGGTLSQIDDLGADLTVEAGERFSGPVHLRKGVHVAEHSLFSRSARRDIWKSVRRGRWRRFLSGACSEQSDRGNKPGNA